MPRQVSALLLLAAGCVAGPQELAARTPVRWRLTVHERIVAFEPDHPPRRTLAARILGPLRPRVGEATAVEISFPDASEGEEHICRVRVRGSRVLLAGEGTFRIRGPHPVRIPFTALDDGPVELVIDEE